MQIRKKKKKKQTKLQNYRKRSYTIKKINF